MISGNDNFLKSGNDHFLKKWKRPFSFPGQIYVSLKLIFAHLFSCSQCCAPGER